MIAQVSLAAESKSIWLHKARQQQVSAIFPGSRAGNVIWLFRLCEQTFFIGDALGATLALSINQGRSIHER
ncbi:MAG: hypothetical protein ACN6QH_08170 [Pseudomonas sp.]|uniref:hypothetical protein n=1 Tax=Pseudomonas sp. TaxID=306 RepID=UPI003D14DE55